MRYDPQLVQPMREELTQLGFQELRNPADVDATMDVKDDTLLVVVNSVCGCAAGKARPGVALAMRNHNRPDRLATVFAGMDIEATARAREFFHRRPRRSRCSRTAACCTCWSGKTSRAGTRRPSPRI
jgi:putative YphP/YqiW family bacilliredoxin